MAISGVVAAATESQWGYVEEATFGTAIADTTAMTKLEGEIPIVADRGITRFQDVLHGEGRAPQDANMYASEVGGVRVIPFSNVKLRRKDLAVFLYSVLQVMDEGETATFTKVLTTTNSTTQPDFAADAGLFLTIGIEDTIASYHRKYTSCVCRSLTLSSQLAGGDGLLYASGEFVSGFASDTTANFITGAWAFDALNYINFGAPAVKTIGGEDIVLYGFDLTFNNNLIRIGNDSSGNAESYGIGLGKTGYEITGNIRCKDDDNTKALIASDIAATSFAVQLEVGTADTTGNVDFVFADCVGNGVVKEYADDLGRVLNVPFRAVYDTAPAAMSVITISDGVDRAWPT